MIKQKVKKLYIKATKGNKILYIKVPITFISLLHDFFHDSGYVIEASNKEIWLNAIYYGLSYRVRTKEEVQEFINNNIKYLISTVKNEK